MKPMPVKDTPENRKKCICQNCPSHPKDCQEEVLYCAAGKSACDIDAQGCFCPGCQVYAENNLETLYFCDKDEIG